MIIGLCDDNKLYLEYLLNKVKLLLPDNKQIEITTIAPNDLHTNIQNSYCPFDLLITDIDMGSYNGIELVKEINKIKPSCIIIFISNFLNYATGVYDADHIYFILKAEADQSLPKALTKAIAVYDKNKNNILNINYLNTNYKISLNDIAYIEAYGRYLHIHSRGPTYKCIHSLKNISTKLSDQFIQCHKSFIVNLDYVYSVNRTDCNLTTGDSIPISYTYSKAFHDYYVEFVSNKINTL